MSVGGEKVQSLIWDEVAEADNPFAAAECFCCGYDVYGDLLGKTSWFEYLYLLITQNRPSKQQARLLELLAVGIANPGPRDHSVRAAMNAGVAGSTYASCLMAALGVGAGQLGGAQDVSQAMQIWQQCGFDLDAWRDSLTGKTAGEIDDIWSPIEHPPGFDPHGVSCTKPVRQLLELLALNSEGNTLAWLEHHRDALEVVAQCPLSISGVAAAAFVDLQLSPAQGEMVYLWLRLPGAAAHALEQEKVGWRNYPFFGLDVHLAGDPGPYHRKVQEKIANEENLGVCA